jgi:ABC-type transport system involved in cytochrome bd biosynthesis fused ATPase/permease subunit
LSRPDAARGFDRVVIIDRGRLKEDGDYQTLSRRDGSLAPLLAAE